MVRSESDSGEGLSRGNPFMAGVQKADGVVPGEVSMFICVGWEQCPICA
jgi:hypothetical protein